MTAIPAHEVKSSRRTAATVLLIVVMAVPLSIAAFALWLDLPAEPVPSEAVYDAGVSANQEHANGKHAEAVEVRDRLARGNCYSPIQRYYAPVRGTALLLCQMTPDPAGVWGGRVVRIASNGAWLGSSSYEASVFAGPRSYFDWVIKRDGYIPAGPEVIQQLKLLAGL